MSQWKIHNVGFYSPECRSIFCMALQKEEGKLAVSRLDGSIEIWNLKNSTFIERTIPSNLQNFSIEGLCWSGTRLFSVGLHGMLIEYDLYKLCVKHQWTVTGEAATCLDINKSNTHIAIGTEHGYINLFQITENNAHFEKFLDKQEGRILCIKFDSTGENLVTGSLNAIRIWNVKSGHAIHKMQLGRSEAKKETVVWCLEVTKDFTIFSGDSRGTLTLWDGKIGAQIETYQSHKADITALCLSDNEQSIYAAGVDPLILNYERVKIKGETYKWVKSIQRKIHDHDVRAMVFYENKLYSAGIDSYLACSFHPPKTLIKHAPIMQSPCVEVASKGRLILLRHPKHVEIWSLAEAENTEESFRGSVQLKSNRKKIVAIQRISKNWAEEEDAEGILCSSISGNGQWILVSTNLGSRLYQLRLINNKPNLVRIEDLDDSNIPCVQARFNNARKQLICALNNGNIVIYDLEDGKPFISQTIQQNRDYLNDTITHLAVSSCGNYLVAADPNSNVVVWKYDKDGYEYYTKLPKYRQGSPTAVGINSQTAHVVIAFSDSQIFDYNLKSRKLVTFSRIIGDSLPSNWKARTYHIRSITFDDKNDNIILLHDDGNVIVVNKDKKFQRDDLTKVRKTEGSGIISDTLKEQPAINTIQKYKHMVHMSSLSKDELVVVEVNPLNILEKLPPAFAQKTFGTK